MGELTRLKSETLAHPDHIAQLPCTLSTHRIANRIGTGELFNIVMVVQSKRVSFRTGRQPGQEPLSAATTTKLRVFCKGPGKFELQQMLYPDIIEDHAIVFIDLTPNFVELIS